MAIAAMAVLFSFSFEAQAQQLPPPAYQLAADQIGVPSEVLYALALTESGFKVDETKVRPWPWTLNVAGQSHYFKTKEDACTFLNKTLQTTSAKRVDVGLGQVNYGYHGHRVDSACALLDPYLNLEIAAQILKEQRRSGEEDWLLAIGRYHSPAGGQRASNYRGVVERHLIRVTGAAK
ncbi:MAG: transglycosylase SLT domain-containing protein [Saezia sp.]